MVRKIRNYAEEFVYWYLRLNGFFSITDFVLHHKGGDTDILAIKPPFASEYVEGKRLKEDELLVEMINRSNCDFSKCFVCIIAEAKGGKSSVLRSEIESKFDLESLQYNLRRLGLFSESEIGPVVENFQNSRWFTVPNFATMHKILFAHTAQFEPKPNDKFSFISLEATRNFIEERMKLSFKAEDWDKFSSEVIQELILRNLRSIS